MDKRISPNSVLWLSQLTEELDEFESVERIKNMAIAEVCLGLAPFGEDLDSFLGERTRKWGEVLGQWQKKDREEFVDSLVREVLTDNPWDREEKLMVGLGRDLHDTVAPFVTGLRLLIGDLLSGSSNLDEDVKERLTKISLYIDKTAVNLINIYRGLVPREIESLEVAIDDLSQSLDSIADTRVVFECHGHCNITDQDTKNHIYRIVQEATDNALKHAQASILRIIITSNPVCVVVEVNDDGCGFDIGLERKGTLGIENMQRRALFIGAQLDIVSQLGTGTTVRIELPDYYDADRSTESQSENSEVLSEEAEMIAPSYRETSASQPTARRSAASRYEGCCTQVKPFVQTVHAPPHPAASR